MLFRSIQVVDKHERLFNGLPESFEAGRYHSWVVDDQTIPDTLKITAVDEHGSIMAIKHHIHDVRGVQFHPESIMTPDGELLLRNWLFS